MLVPIRLKETSLGGAWKKRWRPKMAKKLWSFVPTLRKRGYLSKKWRIEMTKVEKESPRAQMGHGGCKGITRYNNVHATFKLRGHEITYILGQRKNDLGQEEMTWSSEKRWNGKAVNKDSPLLCQHLWRLRMKLRLCFGKFWYRLRYSPAEISQPKFSDMAFLRIDWNRSLEL